MQPSIRLAIAGVMTLGILSSFLMPPARVRLKGSQFRRNGSQGIVSQPFAGVIYIHRKITAPRPLNLHVVLIKLSTPGIKFRVTAPAPDGSTPLEKTVSFTRRLKAQIGINGNLFQYFSFTRGKVLGLAASEGRVYSAWSNHYQGGINFHDRTATFVTPPRELGTTTTPPSTPSNLVTGLPVLIRHGENVTFGVADPKHFAARSAIGLTQDHQLLLFAVDGVRSNVSSGMNQIELADLLLKDFQVVDAVGLDGGGSSTLVFCRPTCAWVNIPSSTTFGIGDRPVANNLAIYVPTIISQSSPSLFGSCLPTWLQQIFPWSHNPVPCSTSLAARS
uniref:Phosphodiester glycosidase domain-containing protein n=1 Tax=Cyanothece sp. (strain PCC 7425 / ATCC 29141) TaxID=395961 RepID=B8HPJ3_CYAP4